MKFYKKSLGQNFLTDKNIINKIINIVPLNKKNIVEIGPGKGALTEEILKKKPNSLILIEKDYILAEQLKNNYKENKKVIVYNQDILKFDLEKKIKKNSIIFGNLPYNISSQILVKTLKFKIWPPHYKALIFMFQKELAEKIIGKFKTPNYGRLAILSNYRLNIFHKFIVSPNSFFPRPKIFSMVLGLEPKKKMFNKIKDMNKLEEVTRILFANKRKKINKNIEKILKNKNSKFIRSLNLNLRPENLKPEIFYKITEIIEKK